MNNAPPALGNVLQQLASESRIAPDFESKMSATLSGFSTPPPWFVRMLVALSAWLATALLLVFVWGTRIVETEVGAIVAGCTLIISALVLRRRLTAEFFRQIALALSLTGQTLLVFGWGGEFGVTEASLTVIALQALLLLAYPDSLHRFLSVLLAVLAAVVLLYELRVPDAIHVLITALAVAVVMGWWRAHTWLTSKAANLCQPINYGMVVALFGVLMPSAVFGVVSDEISFPHAYVSTGTMGIVLIALEIRLFLLHGVAWKSAPVVGMLLGTVLFLIAAAQAPGVVAAIIVLLIGFQFGNHLLTGMAIGFLIFFLSAYYYHLEISLLLKSGSLIGSGLLLLSIWYVHALRD
jgi:hypothetical protein